MPFFRRSPEIGTDIRQHQHALIKEAWGSIEDRGKVPVFVLHPDFVPGGADSTFMNTILKHVRRIAPGLENTPQLVPPIRVSAMTGAGGQFIVENGKVTILISPDFYLKPSVSRAILCHELCHYILSAHKLDLPSREEDERRTDIAMFVLGLGLIFRRGYQTAPASNRQGHRLGYLNDDEYDFLFQETLRLHETGEIRTKFPQRLKNRILAHFKTKDNYQRHFDQARSRWPTKSDYGVDKVLWEQIERG